MKNNMKKLLLIGATVLASAFVYADSVNVNYGEQILLNGWNLYITNAITYGPGVTNQEFTTLNGQIVYSWTQNTINGVLNTNAIIGDAFNLSGAKLAVDANGDVVANAALHIYLNNTNWIPTYQTNSVGQDYVNVTNWVLASSVYPAWQFPATTNLYPTYPTASATNLVTIYLQRGFTYNLGGIVPPITVWDTVTNAFSVTLNGNGASPISVIMNLPTSFTQGARMIRVAGIYTTNLTAASSYLLNQISLYQPNP
jgi:hypothetical protein